MKSAVNKWIKIRRHLTNPSSVRFYDNSLATVWTSNNTMYISKTSDKFRLKSHLDWAYYTPKTLALAIDNLDVDVYYQRQLNHQNSDPNIWKRWDEEQDLKFYYAARAGRASLI
tara:strand:- start:2727 stop:3068 length:342 start_codon:yes stop_codon:yes gene_type:complete